VGGALSDEGGAVAVDSKGNILITGRTESGDFPSTLGSFQFTRAGYYDAYIGKFRPDGSRVWMTYYGGRASGPESGEDWGHSVAAGPNDEVIVCGHTNSPDFPEPSGAFQSIYRGNRDAFLVSFSATGVRLFATMLGGGAWDDAYGVTIDRHGAITVTGGAESGNFPASPGAFQTARSGVTDAFIGRFDAAGSRDWITLFGGARHDFGYGISAYPSGNTVIVGKTNSPDLYVTGDAPQPHRAGSEQYDAFFLKMRPDGAPVWSTYFGGGNIEYGNENDGLGRIAADWRGTASASGWTASADFPVTAGAFQSSNAGGWDAFVTKIGCDIDAPSITADGPTSF